MNVMLSKTFFPQHYRAGEPTHFAEKVKKGIKRHTCRCNYDYWKERIATLQERGGVLSIRQWSGRPYEKGKPQEKLLDVPASLIEVQKLVMTRTRNDDKSVCEEQPDGSFAPVQQYDYSAQVDGIPTAVAYMAKNDGLTLDEFKAWFNPVFDEYEAKVELTKDGQPIQASATTLTFAIIHFTTFRY